VGQHPGTGQASQQAEQIVPMVQTLLVLLLQPIQESPWRIHTSISRTVACKLKQDLHLILSFCGMAKAVIGQLGFSLALAF